MEDHTTLAMRLVVNVGMSLTPLALGLAVRICDLSKEYRYNKGVLVWVHLSFGSNLNICEIELLELH